MAGRPKLRRLEKHISELGGDHVVFDRLANGDTMEEVAASFRGLLPDSPDFPCRTMMYHWIHQNEEREKRWKQAKAIAAHSLIDYVDEMYEEAGKNPPATSAAASTLKQRAGWAKWKAEKWNRDFYGEQPAQHEVNVNFGDLHLDALRKRGQMPTRREPEMLEAEVEEVEYADRSALPDDSTA